MTNITCSFYIAFLNIWVVLENFQYILFEFFNLMILLFDILIKVRIIIDHLTSSSDFFIHPNRDGKQYRGNNNDCSDNIVDIFPCLIFWWFWKIEQKYSQNNRNNSKHEL